MNLDADVVRDQPDDALAIRRRQRQPRVADPFAEPIEKEGGSLDGPLSTNSMTVPSGVAKRTCGE